ncbi:XRE family transcriptional regulator [Cryobacterium sinapicolor]|uniref:XRE family transcriptional regulator n=1 Tax=Cryobacterium sinapicolor TaxID=1259236 RepID=A0ABY2J093_9MICO|nr:MULTISPECIES: XRE family transcriptional regulator [Cryobacterium]TFC91943.1 XRE family transcriptional regulator [Cryobacterium sp. TMT3-29-2]TFC98114.1 XRE family transcriptional regulator [Cryobacterium sinapicolor]
MTETLGPRIGAALKRERNAVGLTVSELARRAGISKATVSQLESGVGNPSVETLWSLGDALGVPFARLVDEPPERVTLIRAADAPRIGSAGSSYAAALLSSSPPNARRDVYLVQAEPGSPKNSAPHTHGTVEHVILISGTALVGPAASPLLLHPGDYACYPGDAPHIFDARDDGTTAVLISELR